MSTNSLIKMWPLKALLVACTVMTLMAPALCLAQGSNADATSLRRFALLAAANNGGKERVLLRFAQSDAQAMARLLAELGGVDNRDRVLLLEPTPDKLRAAFASMKQKIEAARKKGVRLEFVFYYSGHSDEKGLLLNGQLLGYDEIRTLMTGQPADVRIALVDSCASGALTRAKGGKWRPPFTVDESSKVSGHAYLTSSSANEAAQESDRIGGSFFTHFMMAGLRGAADASRDGKITLNEAYQYAFSETLARTEKTSSGAQHPAYEFQLAGAGDLVLTDLRTTSSLLVIPAALEGRFFIRDDAGRLVAEINKTSKQPMSFGLEPGTYTVVLEQGGKFLTGEVVLSTDSSVELKLDGFKMVAAETNRARGDEPAEGTTEQGSTQESDPDAGAEPNPETGTKTNKKTGKKPGVRLEDQKDDVFSLDGLDYSPYSFSFVPGLSTNTGKGERVVNAFSVNLLIEDAYALKGAEFSGLGSFRRGWGQGFQAAGAFNWVSGPFEGFQGSGLFNIVEGNAKGFQGTSVLNQVMGDLWGFQGASALNWVGGEMRGFQAAAGLNWVGDTMKGFQAAAAVNIAKRMEGFQVATLNIARDEMVGMQSGIVNYADKLAGFQLGIVNVAGQADGAALGLFNWIGDGIFQPTIFGSDITPLTVGLKTGTRHFYTMLAFGANHMVDQPYYTGMLGFGGHFNLNRHLFVDFDLLTMTLFNEDNWVDKEKIDMLSSLRLMLGVRPVSWFSIVAGPTLNYLVSERRDSVGMGWNLYQQENDSINYAVAPGFMVGLQIEPQMLNMNDASR